jgi:hypothetical protein
MVKVGVLGSGVFVGVGLNSGVCDGEISAIIVTGMVRVGVARFSASSSDTLHPNKKNIVQMNTKTGESFLVIRILSPILRIL